MFHQPLKTSPTGPNHWRHQPLKAEPLHINHWRLTAHINHYWRLKASTTDQPLKAGPQPMKADPQSLQAGPQVVVNTSWTHHEMVWSLSSWKLKKFSKLKLLPPEGLEPSTLGILRGCSTTRPSSRWKVVKMLILIPPNLNFEKVVPVEGLRVIACQTHEDAWGCKQGSN